jgi:hypothetical protein
MKTKYSLQTRLFSLFLAAQFLNVQIQAAYGTEAMTASSPEVQLLLQQVEQQVTSRLEGKSERQINRLAYQLYKLTLKARNKAVRNELNSLEMDSDDLEVASTFENGTAPVSSEELSQAKKQINQKQVIDQADTLLKALGSETQEDGSLSKASFSEFKEKTSQLNANELRAPASPGRIILKVIFCLLVLLAGIAVFYVIGIFLVLLAWVGTIAMNVAGILVLIFAIGCIIGVILGIKAVVTQTKPLLLNPEYLGHSKTPASA